MFNLAGALRLPVGASDEAAGTATGERRAKKLESWLCNEESFAPRRLNRGRFFSWPPALRQLRFALYGLLRGF